MQGKLDRSRGNVMQHSECYEITATKLMRIAALSKANPAMVFSNLIHHCNAESLTACFKELDGKKAVGIDAVDKVSYGKSLDENIQNLMVRMKRMAYIPGDIRVVKIPKDDGRTFRPLGISNFEDKIVQKMMQKILESVYEPLLHPDSYGFRPGRSCHDAIKALHTHLSTRIVETVIDVDLANYFGSISHQVAIDIISKKIRDPRILRYLSRMFKAGMLSDGELTISDEGVTQGSCCSPVIANIVADEVICKWFEDTVQKHCQGEVKLIIYADDLVVCCQYHNDAVRVKKALDLRLQKFGLKMNEDKTKLVKFSKIKQKAGEDQETFDFLGLTFYLGKSRKGIYLVKVKTSSKRVRSKLKNVKQWIKGIKDKLSLKQIMKKARIKLIGHINYYGVSHNFRAISIFVDKVKKILFKWLNRRSQRKSFSWEKYVLLLKQMNFPVAKICFKLF